MSKRQINPECPNCGPDPGRRKFLTGAGAAAVIAATGGLSSLSHALAAVDPIPKGTRVAPAETTVGKLYESLTTEQKAVAALPFTHKNATHISANWHIVPKKIGELYTPEQQ